MPLQALIAAAALVVPAPAPAQPAAPFSPVGIDYSTARPVDGRWTLALSPSGGAATYYDLGARPLVTFTCTKATRRISIARPVAGAAPFLFIWTSSANRSLPASYNPATKLLVAALPAADPLFDALAFSRGRIVIAPSNAPALVATAYPELARLIEDCRS